MKRKEKHSVYNTCTSRGLEAIILFRCLLKLLAFVYRLSSFFISSCVFVLEEEELQQSVRAKASSYLLACFFISGLNTTLVGLFPEVQNLVQPKFLSSRALEFVGLVDYYYFYIFFCYGTQAFLKLDFILNLNCKLVYNTWRLIQ